MERFLKKTRIFIIIFWVLAAVVAVFALPNVSQLVQNKGQITVPRSANVSEGRRLQKKLNPGEPVSSDIIAVYNSGANKKLTKRQISEIRSSVTKVSRNRAKYHITAITSLLDGKSVRQQLTSKDQTTMLVQISVKSNQNQISQRSAAIKQALKADHLRLNMTGSSLVNHDFASATQDGVKKTEVIAIVFILIILVLVFKTPIIPVISLLTVGISFLTSFSLVTNLVQNYNFPFSNFTQVFMVVVLFGIGTDYNILFYTRFKRELGLNPEKTTNEIAVKTLFSAGKTILFSGSSVLIGFSTLALAKFSLYQATSAVAISVLILLLVLITLTPALMSLFGHGLYWPSKNFDGEGGSKIWQGLTSTAVKHSVITALATLIIAVPVAMMFSNRLNFNDLWEVPNQYESKRGINLIQKHFPAGFSSPMTLIISGDKRLDNNQQLYALDMLQNRLKHDKDVSAVMGVTRPLGDRINQLYVNNQLKTLNSGIGQAGTGVSTINNGLKNASDQLGRQQTNTNGVQRLINGTGQLSTGANQLQAALNTLQSRLASGAAGADQLNDALATLSASTDQLKNGVDQILAQLNQTQVPSREQVQAQIDQLNAMKTVLTPIIQNAVLSGQLPVDQAERINQAFADFPNQLQQLSGLGSQIDDLKNGLTRVDNGLGAMQSGIARMRTGAGQLSSGMQQGASGAGEIASRTNDLTNGLAQIQAGQQQMKTALDGLASRSRELKNGLDRASDGLNQVGQGLNQGQSYVKGLVGNSSSDWLNVPDSVLHSKTFKRSLDQYMSPDRKTTQLTVILKLNPFSHPAIGVANHIKQVTARSLSESGLDHAKVGITGTSMQNFDLQKISTSDFLRTAIIMLIGITLVMILITHSTLYAVTIVASLAGTYFVSLGIGEKISQVLLGRNMLSWNVPFFSFIMLIALGVDYAIFVMMAFNEERGSTVERLVSASNRLGKVVMSAVVILGGTFAAMIPSGILTLIQVPIVVITGLLILAFVTIPMFIPAVITISDWMLRRKFASMKKFER
ncbi:MAG: MMPL family transporter [Oenococcus sp.]|uniref:MMPL family transporter n=1 Tax=Oenococcus sp. TaxID=1979414 RepID=UPI0039ECAA93